MQARMATQVVRASEFGVREKNIAGLLFNRPNPRPADGDKGVRKDIPENSDKYGYDQLINMQRDGTYDYRNNYGDFGDPRKEEDNEKAGGYDPLMLPDDDRNFYRVPDQSVVNKVGEFCPCGRVTLTAAQWIYFANLVCFLAHFTMIWVTVYFHHWSSKGEKDLALKVFRIQINYTFTEGVMDENGPPRPQNFRYSLIDNGMPIDIGVICCVFYGLSAGFHFLALIMGLFPRFWPYYWRQMDDAFCWWRWVEYVGSASVMAMGIAVSLGMREENILASIFLLHVCTMVCGFATELWSRPRSYPDGADYAWRAGPGKGYEGLVQYSALKQEEQPNTDGTSTVILKAGNPNALKRIAQDEWEGDRPLRFYDASAPEGERWKRYIYNSGLVDLQYFMNFVRRMLPHAFGYIPMTGAWVMMIKFLETSKLDVQRLHNRDDLEIPDWVSVVLYGTVIIFWSFSVIQIVFQYLPPNFYWGSELIYCFMSLTSKLYLGLFLLINVILQDGSAEDILGGGGVSGTR